MYKYVCMVYTHVYMYMYMYVYMYMYMDDRIEREEKIYEFPFSLFVSMKIVLRMHMYKTNFD